ncbi:TPA: hypothetical protein DIS60_03705 [Patescibacteria group bacterium]|nr:hypothetical protein [Patescibacteria group bacterium]
MVVRDLVEVSPYRYRFTDRNGIVENEICPILMGFTNDNPVPNEGEVADWKWIGWKEFLKDTEDNPNMYSPWCREETVILQRANPELQ